MATIDVSRSPLQPKQTILSVTSTSESHTEHGHGSNNLDEMSVEQFALEAGESNEPLSISQQKSVLQQVQLEINDLDSQISHVLNTLGAKRDQAAVRLHKYRVATAPHKNLPSEVLGNIFIQHLAQYPFNVGLPQEDPDVGAGALSFMSKSWAILHICKRWRQVAMEDPRVWSSIHVYYGARYEKGEEKSAFAREILSRSGNVPILLSLRLNQKYPDHICTTNPVTSVVLPYARRIQFLQIIGFPREWLYPLLDLPSGQLESLETVVLNMMVGFDRAQQMAPDVLSPSPSTVFDSAPRLRVVALQADHALRLVPAKFLCPWNQLTSLQLSLVSMHVAEAGRVMLNAVNLVQCELYAWIAPGAIASCTTLNLARQCANSPVVVHSSLRTLVLCVNDSDVCSFLFSIMPFSFPSLSTLHIRGQAGHGSPSTWTSAVHALISRSECTLDDFSTTLPVSEAFEQALFDHMPGLTSLSILQSSIVPTSFFERLTRRQLLPELEILDCQIGSLGPFLDYLEMCLDRDAASDGVLTGVRFASIFIETRRLDQGACNRLETLKPRLIGRRIDVQSSQYGVMMLPTDRRNRVSGWQPIASLTHA